MVARSQFAMEEGCTVRRICGSDGSMSGFAGRIWHEIIRRVEKYPRSATFADLLILSKQENLQHLGLKANKRPTLRNINEVNE